MDLVMDIGNTSSKVYIFENGSISGSFYFESEKFSQVCGKDQVPNVIIASVVPAKTTVIADEVKKITGAEPFVINRSHYPGLKSAYLNLDELGIDRLCNVAYAVRYFSKNVIVIDLGSAVTFEIIGTDGGFEGGMILPGIRLQYESLSKNTALLPELEATTNPRLIGITTKECIASGVENGIAGVCDSFVEKIKRSLGAKMKVVLSGGDAELFSGLVSFEHIVEKNTVPLGAYEIFRLASGSGK
jgi:type III pantothenate kinase